MPILSINHNTLEFQPGMTILEVARKNNIHIPTLCYLAGCTPTGQCRICVVEVDGAEELLPACETPAGDGMKIMTGSPRVHEARKTIIEMLVASGAHNCLVMQSPAD
ncbi:MAG: 2Fe-2S iron-sulfur cluster-binding protein, partial [Desulfobacteraceae bacterium]|nr:2Fe-2S iron-sulfur cluster-binding protein [Desulfobacteraceae bacterium]